MALETASPAEIASRFSLPRLGGRPPLGRYTRQLWARRHFGIELARSRFKAENEQDRLGIAWVVIRPLMNAAIYGLIFGVLLKSNRGTANFIAYLVVGVFVFQYFASSLQDGAKSITGNMGLVRSLHFPRALLPLATVIQQAFAMVPMTVIMVIVVLATREPVQWRWLQLPLALGLMSFFCAGVALIAARLTIHIRDIAQLIPFLTRIIFYLSGVFFSIDHVVTNPALRLILSANPSHVYLALARGALLKDLPVNPLYWPLAVVWAIVFAVGGYLFFWHAEERYGRE